ncbi:MAG: acyltransferase [Gammaproteobacteria bacterium]|nr:acyltransferase [Gammaproteobacteria bacterium]
MTVRGEPRWHRRWARLWMRQAHRQGVGRAASWLAGLFLPPLYGRVPLAGMNPRGYLSPRAHLFHPGLSLGRHCFIGDRVLFYRDSGGADVTLGDGVHIHQDTVVQTGQGGRISIGDGTHIQSRCQLSAYLGALTIGARVEIAPNCAFYSYNHGMDGTTSIREQPLVSSGGISVGDEAWIGFGAILLDGARIGRGAVIGAGAVVVGEVPACAVAIGVPARIVGMRGELPTRSSADERAVG